MNMFRLTTARNNVDLYYLALGKILSTKEDYLFITAHCPMGLCGDKSAFGKN